ncbi:hypothetical protein PS2_018555 [Malus domestica]
MIGFRAHFQQFKNRRGASFLKSWACLETTGQSSFPDLSALVTYNLCIQRSSELEEATSEIGEASAFPNVSAPVTYTLSFVKITSSLSKRRFQISKRHQLYPDMSASVTYTLSLVEITGNLSKISGEVESTKADIHNLPSSPRMPSQRSLSSHSVFLIPWGTSANNSSKAKVFHIMKRKRVISQHLVSIFRFGTDCLEPLPDCLPSPALEYSSSTSYASSSSTTSAWGTDKGSENDTSKHVETMC